ncbi:MAG: ABC transporter substrate-binding protein [Chromatocurvus sp.]
MRSSRYISGIAAMLMAVGLLMAPLASAQEQTAEAVLKKTTDQVLSVIEEAADYVRDDPDRYYRRVNEVLDDVVDFRGFARGVMGDYASSERYRSLDEAGRETLRKQLDRFTTAMREGLVRTYSKGLLAFGGSRVELDQERSTGTDEGDPGRATLRQLIYSDASEPYVVIYQMAKNRDGQWLIRNLIVENVNLGQIYRSQFEAAARKFDGDLDKVIADWEVEPMEDDADSETTA